VLAKQRLLARRGNNTLRFKATAYQLTVSPVIAHGIINGRAGETVSAKNLL
jgi:hypothetical protein